MKKSNFILLLSILIVGILLVSCSSKSTVTPNPQIQSQQPVVTEPVSTQTTETQPSQTTQIPPQVTQNSSTTETTTQTAPAKETPVVSGITLAELQTHNSKSDCWVVYKGEVYDVTTFLPIHPGGVQAISRYCGTTDFESAFKRQHGTSQEKRLKSSSSDMGVFLG